MYQETEVYKSMYLHLMNACENTVRLLSDAYYQNKDETKTALQMLIAAQTQCEEIYLSVVDSIGDSE